ncbi:MAG: hypothetical protein U0871_03435 [Gemmataceae bacterium]
MIDTPKFELGQVVATPGCLDALRKAGQTVREFVARHLRLEQGELCDDDRHANQMSLMDGSRILSAFRLKTGVKVWVLTEAVGDDGKRASTCLLLPEEY